MSLTTPTQTTLTQTTAAGSTATTVTPTTTASPNPYLLGWTSVSAENGTPIYSSATCNEGLTFSASNTCAGCLGASPTAILWTTCESSTLLVGASQVTTCAVGEVCKTDTIYQTVVNATPTQAFYCAPSTASEETWFRSMPTPGLAWAGQSLDPTNGASNGQNTFPIGAVGGGGGVVLLLIIIFFLWCCCCHNGNGGNRGKTSGGRNRSSDNNHNNDYPMHERHYSETRCGCCGCMTSMCNCTCCCRPNSPNY